MKPANLCFSAEGEKITKVRKCADSGIKKKKE
jgi:hypothetical protein